MFAKILVGTDGSDTASLAVRQAGELAVSLGAVVHVVAVYAGAVRPDFADRADRDKVANATQEVLGRASEQLRSLGVTEVHEHPADGDPAEAILDIAEQVGADLVVVGNKGVSGVRRFLLGSVAQKVVQHAPCAVLVVRTS